MRLSAYLILAYIFLGLHIGLKGFLGWGGGEPEIVLLAVIFIAIHAPRDAALLGAFGLGLFQDLLSVQPLGMYALAYSLTAMFVVSTQAIVYREHPLTHVSLAFIGGLFLTFIFGVHGWIWPSRPVRVLDNGEIVGATHMSIMALLLSAIYTAVLSPFVLFVLNRIRGLFAFQPSRKRIYATRGK